MKKLNAMRWALLAAVVMVGVSALARGADAPQQPVIPDGLKGFKGTLAGTVVSAQDNGLGFVLKVTTATAGDGSTASDPQSAVGQSLLINVKFEKGSNSKYRPAGARRVRLMSRRHGGWGDDERDGGQ